MSRRIVVLSGGVSDPSSSRRLADRLAASTAAALLERHERAVVTVIEVRDLAHDVVDATVARIRSARLDEALASVTIADGLIAVSPVFNASIAGLFTSFVDLIEPGSLDGIPVAIGVTAGSDRHSLVLDHALRPLLSYLHASVVPTGVHAQSSDLAGGERSTALQRRIDRAGAELALLVAARPRQDRAAVDAELEALLQSLG